MTVGNRILFKFAFVVILLATAWFFYERVSPEKKDIAAEALSFLPKKDRELLSQLSEEILCHTDWGYTLFGDKPISSIDIRNEWARSETLKHLIDLSAPILKTYAHFLKGKNFVVHVEQSQDVTSYYLLHKKAFLRAVQENIDLFREKHGNNVSPLQIFNSIHEETSIFDDVCKKSQALCGILFGYGKQNAMAFERRSKIFRYLEAEGTPPWKFSLNPETLSVEDLYSFKSQQKQSTEKLEIVPSLGFSSLQEELSFLQTKLREHSNLSTPGGLVFPVFFVGDPESPETKVLIEKYEQDRRFLTKVMTSGKALEIVIEQLST